MLVELKHFEGQKEKPWYVIMNDNDRFNVEKFASEQDDHEIYQTIKNSSLPENSKPASKENDAPKFSEYAEHYLSTYVKVVCKVHTWKHYKRIIEGHLIPAWTSKTLDQISRADIKCSSQYLIFKKKVYSHQPLEISEPLTNRLFRTRSIFRFRVTHLQSFFRVIEINCPIAGPCRISN